MRYERHRRYWGQSQRAGGDLHAVFPARPWARTSRWLWPATALASFIVLCSVVLMVAPQLVEPDDYAYRASIVAVTEGHLLTLSTAQARALAARLADSGSGPRLAAGPGGSPASLTRWRWEQVSRGRWMSEKNPGYPFLAAPFQLLGVIRLAPLFFGALACLGLFFGARLWLGSVGGAAAVGLFCSSGAALVFAWRDYMPTFTDASLIAAGAGALLWAMLAETALARRRTCVGLAGLLAIEAAVFVRYTDIVVLCCAVGSLIAIRRLRATALPPGGLRWWLGSVLLFGISVAAFNDRVYGGPFSSGYRPGEVTFSLAAVVPNLRYLPPHLIRAVPMAVLGLAGFVWIVERRMQLAGGPAKQDAGRGRDFAVGLALAASWVSLWTLYVAYTWTAQPGLSALQTTRFYVPAIGPIALLGAWLIAHLSARLSLGEVLPVAILAAMFALGIWSFNDMRPTTVLRSPHCNIGQPGCRASAPPEQHVGPQGGPHANRLPAGRPQAVAERRWDGSHRQDLSNRDWTRRMQVSAECSGVIASPTKPAPIYLPQPACGEGCWEAAKRCEP